MTRLLAALLFALFCAALPARAQLIPGLGPAQAENAAGEGGSEASAAQSAEALIGILNDAASRDALIAELTRIAGAGEEVGAADGEAAKEPSFRRDAQTSEPEPAAQRGLAARLSTLARGSFVFARDRIEGFADGVSETVRQLGSLSHSGGQREFIDSLRAVGLTILATITALFVLRIPVRRLTGRIGATARSAPLFMRALRWIGVVAINVLTVLIGWGVGWLMAWLIGPDGEISRDETLFLSAFLVAQLARVGVRAIFMPRSPALRLFPMPDKGAAYVSGRFCAIAALLGYGLLFIAPMIGDSFTLFTRRAIEVVIYSIALLWTVAVTWRRRAAPLREIRAREARRGADASTHLLKAFAHVWHWPVLAWLLALFVFAVSNPVAVGPLVLATSKALAALAATGLLSAGLGEIARRGVRLPDSVTVIAPMLESRINRFLRSFLGVFRLLILLLGVVAAVNLSGLVTLGDDRLLSEETLAAMISVGMIVAIAFAIWLAMVSYVDYRLSPDRLPHATPREETLLTLFRNAATVAIAIIALMMSFSELGLDIAPLLASAGVLGLAIGFGAQKLVQDIITGVFIQFERAISVGDVVTVAGTTGTVEKLTVRSVSLRDLDGVFHIIPFSSVDMVSNFTRDFSCYVADLGIAYREDVADGKAAMLDAFAELRETEGVRDDVIGDLEWFGVNALGDSAVTLRARIRTRPGRQWAVGRAYNELLKKHCDARDIEIPFPQTTLWFGVGKDGGAPPLRIDAKQAKKSAPQQKNTENSFSSPDTYDTPDSPSDGEGGEP